MTSARRWIAAGCALLAAAAFALAVQGLLWWRIGPDTGIGPTSTRNCFGDGPCQQTGLSWTGGSETWVKAGAATYAAGLVAALILVALAGALAARASGRLVAMSAAVATVTAGVVGTIFVTSHPSLPDLRLGLGAPLYFAGAVLALVAIVLVLVRRRT